MSRLVRDVMTADPITVAEETTLIEVAELLGANRIGGVPVVGGGGRLIGVVSAFDLVSFVGSEAAEARLGGPAVVWSADDVARAAVDAPPRGFLDLAADGGDDVLDRFGWPTAWKAPTLEDFTAGDIMSPDVLTARPDEPIRDAAARMVENGVHRLFVVERAALVGVITTQDLARVIARR